MSILENVQEVTQRMEQASEKSSFKKQVQLIGVTKSVSSQVASELLAAGVTHLGENRPDGLLEKQAELRTNRLYVALHRHATDTQSSSNHRCH